MKTSNLPEEMSATAVTNVDAGRPIVSVQAFIEATRDSGYKSTSAAIAEFVDNSIEADASAVHIEIAETFHSGEREITISVLDDGCGMAPEILELALQFGGSTRFASRKGSGRYGMGLPNGSLSQARRVEVVTWESRAQGWMSYLDVDEIASGRVTHVPRPKSHNMELTGVEQPHGTLVTLRRCDRLDFKRAAKLAARLKLDLGRLFRRFIVGDGRLFVNSELVVPIDPTFLLKDASEDGATPYGPPLEYSLRYSDRELGIERTASVSVVFAELPLVAWHDLSNEEKNRRGIAKGAGVAILRAGREIDYGWFFMGNKRRENYDDWWRCEINFPPELDELFGVTHTKQRIRPSEQLIALLSPDIERIARELSARVRRLYASIRSKEPREKMLAEFSKKDALLEPPISRATSRTMAKLRSTGGTVKSGMTFDIRDASLDSRMFFEPSRKGFHLAVTLNSNHPFYRSVFDNENTNARELQRCIQTLLVAAARSEVTLKGKGERETIKRFRQSWSDSLVAFLT
jgi:hypothetical protein